MDHLLSVSIKITHYREIVSVLSMSIILASIIFIQGCATKISYGERHVSTLQISKAMGVGRGGYDKPNVIISKLDFVPIERVDYKLKWTGNAITYTNCYHFKPIIELEEPAPKTFTRDFDIVKDRWWIIADEMIGGFSVTFNEGSKVPSEIKYDSSLISSSAVPPGTPDPVYGKFWMGCTKKKKIKANADKDGEDGDVYITLSPIMIPADGVTIGGLGSSPKHHVSCERIGGTPPASPCGPTQKCCEPAPGGECHLCAPANAECP